MYCVIFKTLIMRRGDLDQVMNNENFSIARPQIA